MSKKYNILDAGYALVCSNLWPEPIEKPITGFIGINGTSIKPSQIPFDHTKLNSNIDFIENEYGEVLYYEHDNYRLYTNDISEFLVNWFSEWKQVPYEK